jgi:hypothetical protein
MSAFATVIQSLRAVYIAGVLSSGRVSSAKYVSLTFGQEAITCHLNSPQELTTQYCIVWLL